MDIGYGLKFSFFVFEVCITWALFMIFFAYNNSFLTERQMNEDWHFRRGIPLFDHWGFRSSVLLITPTLSVIIPTYSHLWSDEQLRISFAVATIVGVGMTYLWTKGTKEGLPESTAIDGDITIVGALLMCFLIAAITCFI